MLRRAVLDALATILLLTLIAGTLFVWYVAADRAGWLDPPPPVAWREAAGASDILAVPGRAVVYWGRPDASYSVYATRSAQKPRAIVVHFTAPKPVLNLVRYGHRPDPERGNAAYGYHFYIGRDGRIVQGAPLSRRTNHIKSAARPERTDMARHLWSGNAIGVALVGGCDPLRSPLITEWGKCARETVTDAQIAAGLAVIEALRERYLIPCAEVYGHGDLQTDRQPIEGVTLSRLARTHCNKVSS